MSNFFEKPKSKIMPSTSIFAQVVDGTVLPLTIALIIGGGGGGGGGGGKHPRGVG